MEYLDKEKNLNPFQRDYYIKQFNDVFYNGSAKYRQPGNFQYVACTNTENRTSVILENMLHFLMRYPEFTQRTGIGLIELLEMDPSTSDMIKHIWSELMKPEEKKQEELAALHKQINDLNKHLKNK